ncbi:MAG: ABC transporter permease [Desulfuromonadales bacterium]|nr:ABC transporter permease [Desulfuromonadales bacterium]
MKRFTGFSFSRWWSIVIKEFLQLKRDRITFAMIVAIPVLQLVLFGYVINTDPKNMPTAIISNDSSVMTRTIISAMEQSGYFKFVANLPNEEAGKAALSRGKVLFVVNIPTNFTKRVIRGEYPSILVEADATDPTATAMALAAVMQLPSSVVTRDLTGSLAFLAGKSAPFEVRVHRLYNPEAINQYNIVPGLMGVILTMMMVLMTGLAITRERERGTMENLLAMPVRPLEIMTGKIVPYIAIGLIQATIILLVALLLFRLPFFGNILLLYFVVLLFVAANLTVGIMLSSIAGNQLQAMQLTMFYFLPNILISGFMFPFLGMPKWAQYIGSILPLTYFNRLVRGIFLKGSSFSDLWPNIWPMMVFTAIVMTIAVKFYKKTLD